MNFAKSGGIIIYLSPSVLKVGGYVPQSPQDLRSWDEVFHFYLLLSDFVR